MMLKVHMSLAVKDIGATREFYQALFQSQPAKIKDDYVKFTPDNLALNISFTRSDSGRAIDPRRHHLGIEFPSQALLDKEFERLRAAGMLFGGRESSICCYADQDKFHVRDPDGYEWELYYLLSDTEIRIQATTNCCTPETGRQACCGQ